MEGISGSPPGPGMNGAPRVVRRPSSTYVTPSRLAARRAASLNSSSACVCHLDVVALRRFTPAAAFSFGRLLRLAQRGVSEVNLSESVCLSTLVALCTSLLLSCGCPPIRNPSSKFDHLSSSRVRVRVLSLLCHLSSTHSPWLSTEPGPSPAATLTAPALYKLTVYTVLERA